MQLSSTRWHKNPERISSRTATPGLDLSDQNVIVPATTQRIDRLTLIGKPRLKVLANITIAA
jgi:hypothetical protein